MVLYKEIDSKHGVRRTRPSVRPPNGRVKVHRANFVFYTSWSTKTMAITLGTHVIVLSGALSLRHGRIAVCFKIGYIIFYFSSQVVCRIWLFDRTCFLIKHDKPYNLSQIISDSKKKKRVIACNTM